MNQGACNLRRFATAVAALVVLTCASMATADDPPLGATGASGAPITREQMARQLQAREAEVELESKKASMDAAKVKLDETRRLFDERLVKIDELKRDEQLWQQAVVAYKQAEIQLRKTRLDFLKDATLITVVDARKVYDQGTYRVSVTLRNNSDPRLAAAALGDDDTVTSEELTALLDINNVVVTLIGNGAMVGRPYQHVIKVLRHAQDVTLDFELQDKTVDPVTIRIEYLGEADEHTVVLAKEASQDYPTVEAIQYAREGQLGAEVHYPLELERLATSDQSFAPVVLNLPSQIGRTFKDAEGGQVTQLRFTADKPNQSLTLVATLPRKLDQSFVDKSIEFDVVLIKPKDRAAVDELTNRYRGELIPAEEIAKLKGERVSLLLIPRGVGKLDIFITNKFREMTQEEALSFRFTLINSGTITLNNAEPKLDLPLDWEGTLTPKSVSTIEPGERVNFTADIVPVTNVTIGEYKTKINAEAHTGIDPVEALAEDFTVRVVAERNITATFILVGVLIGLVLIIAIASVKISRR